MTASDTMHVVARVGTERFAFRVAEVEEALDAPGLVAVPNAPAGMRGQLVHRERTVSAYDAAWAFGVTRAGEPASTGTALVLRVADDRVALVVDDVEDLASLDSGTMRPAPAGTDPNGLLRGVCLPRAGGAARRSLIGVVNTVAVVARASHGGGAPRRPPVAGAAASEARAAGRQA